MSQKIPYTRAELQEPIKQSMKAQEYFGDKRENLVDTDKYVMWDDLINEHRYDSCIMANNEQLRREYNSRKVSGTHHATGMNKQRVLRHIAAIPLWLYLRMEILTGDPDFWKDESNLKKILDIYPEYALVDKRTL